MKPRLVLLWMTLLIIVALLVPGRPPLMAAQWRPASLTATAPTVAEGSEVKGAPPAHDRTRAAEAPHDGPVMFIQNVGQFDERARFQVRGTDRTVWLTENSIWVTVLGPVQDEAEGLRHKEALSPSLPRSVSPSPRQAVHLELTFTGANPHLRLEPFNFLDTCVSYLIGSDPEHWRPNVPVWGGVRYTDIYPGIDLEITGGETWSWRLVARTPVADLEAVRLRVNGADGLTLEGPGDTAGQPTIRVSTTLGEFALPLLDIGDAAAFCQDAAPQVMGHEIIAPFARGKAASSDGKALTRALDRPEDLLYATFLGGSDLDFGSGIAVDGTGSAYVTGDTWSSDFPAASGPGYDTAFNGSRDAFVVKLPPNGTSLDYATFLGGSDRDFGCDIAVDGTGSAYVTGFTESSGFPAASGPGYDTSYNGVMDAFVVKLNANGTGLDYATFLGGSDDDYGNGITVDGTGSAYVTGYTESTDFPAAAGPGYDTNYNGGWCDAFVVKLNANGTGLDYATFLGGSNAEGGYDIAVDGTGSAYVTGYTESTDFPAASGPGYDTSHNGDTDAFVVKLNANGTGLDYATFLGGSDQDYGYGGIAVDGSGSAYVTGYTESTDFPAASGPGYDTSHNGDTDAFVVKLNASGTGLDYATFLGGSDQDYGNGIAVNGSGNAYVTGYTESTDFPAATGPGYDTSYNGGDSDAFVVKLNPNDTGLDYATFLGGSDLDYGYRITVDGTGSTYVTGVTESSDFPAASGPGYDASHNGDGDAFVVKLETTGIAQTDNYALRFDGDSDYVRIEDSSSLRPTDITVEGWFKFDSTPSGIEVLIAKTLGSGNWESYTIFWGGDHLRGLISDADGYGPWLNYEWTPAPATWYHTAYTFDDASNHQVLYLNGEPVVSGTVAKSIAYDSHPVIIGAEYESEDILLFFGGEADEVRIWNVARSATEIAANYDKSLIGNEPGLVAYYRFDEGSGQILNDTTANQNDGQLGSTPSNDSNDPTWVTSTAPVGPGATDTTPPATVTDLTARPGTTAGSVDLSWTAPGDDGNTGTASTYIVRYNTTQITEANWDSSADVIGEPSPGPAESAESMSMSGLTPGQTYYFALKAQDEVPNISGISNVALAQAEGGVAFDADVIVWADKDGDDSYDNGEELENATVLWEQSVEYDAPEGQVHISGLQLGDKLYATAKIYERDAVKHQTIEPIMYELYLDSDEMKPVDSDETKPDGDGSYESYKITQPGTQMVQLRHPIFKWNLVVSLEWDDPPSPQDGSEMDDILDLFIDASSVLYDATDGQMMLNRVTIYDDQQHWSDADICMKADPKYRAGTKVSGVYRSHSGNSVQVEVLEPKDTIVHELGHYFMKLWDEYEDGLGRESAKWGYRESHPEEFPSNYGLMDKQWNSIELSSSNDYLDDYGLILESWKVTRQYWEYQKPAWEFVQSEFSKPEYTGDDYPITIIIPEPSYLERGQPNQNGTPQKNTDRPGPDVDITKLPVGRTTMWISINSGTPEAFNAQLTLTDGGQPAYSWKIYSRKGSAGSLVYQGVYWGSVTQVRGLHVGDSLVFRSPGRISIWEATHTVKQSERDTHQINIDLVSSRAAVAVQQATSPKMIVTIGASEEAGSFQMNIAARVDQPLPNLPVVTVYAEGIADPIEQVLSQVDGSNVYSGTITIGGSTEGLTIITATGIEDGESRAFVDFQIGQIVTGSLSEIASRDNKAVLSIPAGAVASDYWVAVASIDSAIPLPAAGSLVPLGRAFGFQIADGGVTLNTPALVTIYYDDIEVAGLDENSIQMFKWDETTEAWVDVEETISSRDNLVQVEQDALGTYGLFAPISSDTTPPVAITDLSAVTSDHGWAVDLSWTAPGDDGSVGTATEYVVRFNNEPITNDNWEECYDVGGEPIPNATGTTERLTIDMPDPNTAYYFGIKAKDEAGNLSELSNIISARSYALDTDADGIPNMWEVSNGLDPNVNDADYDPDTDDLPNRAECESSTDPWDWDTDGDGYSDGHEVAIGSDPLDRDSRPNQIDLQPSWNLISLSVEPSTPYTAESMCDEINAQGGIATIIQSWDGSGWQAHECGQPFGDFDIETDRGYFVYCNGASTWTMAGSAVSALTVSLASGWNLIGVPIGSYSAESMCDEINTQGGSATVIQNWDGSGWQPHQCGQPFGDFFIESDRGYFVRCTAPSTWIPGQ
jgi:hypothetical protein